MTPRVPKPVPTRGRRAAIVGRCAGAIAGRFAGVIAAGALGTLLAAGCAPSGYFRNTEAQLDSLLTTQGELMRRVERLDKKVEETQGGVRTTRASADTRLNQISERLEVLLGQIEATNARMQAIGIKVEGVQRRMAAPDTARGPTGMAPRDTSGVPEPEMLYQAAYSDIAAGRYALARQAFQDYVRHYPDSEVADNAQYWIGESLYATGDFRGAIEEYKKVEANYPKGDKVPAALFKIGVSHARLNEPGEARKYLNQVIQKYPRSPEAGLAKERLAQLSGAPKSSSSASRGKR